LESCGNKGEEFLSRISRAQVEAYAPSVADDDGSDADEFVSDGSTCGLGQAGVLESGAPDVIEEHIGERTEHEP
jgi:hypothetical protein